MAPAGHTSTHALQLSHAPSIGLSSRRGASVSTVTNLILAPKDGFTRRLFLPIQPRPASLATALWERCPLCLAQSST